MEGTCTFVLIFRATYPLSDVDYRDARRGHGERHDEDVSFGRFGVAIAAGPSSPGGCEVTYGPRT